MGMRGGRTVMVESSRFAKPWRESVLTQSHEQYKGSPLTGPLSVNITFWLARPKNHYRMVDKELSNIIKANAPIFSTSGTQGDIDKIARCTLDGLQSPCGGCVIQSDALVVSLQCEKRYVTELEGSGATIHVIQR